MLGVRETPGRETIAPFVLLEIERRSAVSLSHAVKIVTAIRIAVIILDIVFIFSLLILVISAGNAADTGL